MTFHKVSTSKPFSAFRLWCIAVCFSLLLNVPSSRKRLEEKLFRLFTGEAPLAGLPLLKKCPPDTFSIHPFRAPPVFLVGAPLRTRLCLVLWSGLCPNTPPASGARLDRALFDPLADFYRFVAYFSFVVFFSSVSYSARGKAVRRAPPEAKPCGEHPWRTFSALLRYSTVNLYPDYAPLQCSLPCPPSCARLSRSYSNRSCPRKTSSP